MSKVRISVEVSIKTAKEVIELIEKAGEGQCKCDKKPDVSAKGNEGGEPPKGGG